MQLFPKCGSSYSYVHEYIHVAEGNFLQRLRHCLFERPSRERSSEGFFFLFFTAAQQTGTFCGGLEDRFTSDSIFQARRLGFPGAELSRGGAARIKASCGIKNLCNQLSNLLPHISRPMSRHPLSLKPSARRLCETLDPPSTLFSRGGCFSFLGFSSHPPPPPPTSLRAPGLFFSIRFLPQRRRRRAFVWDIKYLFS